MRKFLLSLLVLAMSFSLGACSSAKKSLGLTKSAPDEFTVMSRAPLSIPPGYDLTPPRPGAVRPQEGTAETKAKNALLEASAIHIATPTKVETFDTENLTEGEKAFLKLAKTDNALPDIRRLINQENSSLIEESKEFIDRLVFWRQKDDPTAVLVDPEKETKRIENNQALGKEVTEGTTPIISRKRKGLLEGVF